MKSYQVVSKLYDKKSNNSIPIMKTYIVQLNSIKDLKDNLNTFFSEYNNGDIEYELELSCSVIVHNKNKELFSCKYSLFDNSILEISLFIDTKFKSIEKEVRLDV